MMPTCERVLEHLETYLDGELQDEVAHAVAEHLDACPECLEYETFVARLRAIVRAKLGREPLFPDDLVARIRAGLAREAELRAARSGA
jgi:anti-sigma factor (TIGR02949 family)